MKYITICDEIIISIPPNITLLQIENQIPAEERHSAVMMWPGSKIAYKELTPTYSEYNS